MQRIVLPRHDVIVLVAFLAGEIRRARVRAHINAAAIDNVGNGRAGDVGKDDSGEQLDAVRLHHAVSDLLALSRLEAVVFDNKLNRHATELAAFHVDRELKRVADVGTEITAGAGQRGDQTDFHRLLRQCRCREHGRNGHSQSKFRKSHDKSPVVIVRT